MAHVIYFLSLCEKPNNKTVKQFSNLTTQTISLNGNIRAATES